MLMPRSGVRSFVILACLAVLMSAGSIDADKLSSRERKDRIAALEEKYLQFLEEVDPIMSETELDVFLKMESDPQRDRFIEEFWLRRDPDPETSRNGYRDAYYARREIALERYRGVNTDRGRIYLLNGEPARVVSVDTCVYLRPIEIWLYGGSDESLLFVQPTADFVLWQGSQHSAPAWSGGNSVSSALEELLTPTGREIGVQKLFFPYMESNRIVPAILEERCLNGDVVVDAVHASRARGQAVRTVFEPPRIDEEDVRRMLESSVVSDPDAEQLDGSLNVSFGDTRGSRILVRLIAEIPSSSLDPVSIGDRQFYQLNVIGETLKDGQMFDRWEYRFEFPKAESPEALPVMVERALREGKWELRMKVTDPESGAETVLSRSVDVPAAGSRAEGESGSQDHPGEETRSAIRLLPPDGGVLTGLQNFEAIVDGEGVAGVEFYLDGTKIMRKMRAPFSLELDLGPVPRPHVVRAVALDRRREPLDEDVLQLNDGADPFRVRIVSPRIGRDATGMIRVEMEPEIPDDASLSRLELYLNDERVATLFNEPWIQPVLLAEEPQLSVLRVVAILADESVRPVEDVVILNGPENLEHMNVRLIEVPTTVLTDGHPVRHLPQEAFTVLDSDEPVQLAKFERLSNLPLLVGIAIDGSASMKDRLDGARNAADEFLKSVLTPRDRAFLISFDRRVFTLSDWTSDPETMTEGLASLRAEESTAMYDAVIESLYRFVGLEGQRALILISDGADTASRYEWDSALEYARRMAVPIYTVGIAISPVQIEARLRLQALASHTGGRSWFISEVSELSEPYEQIERELRSQYLLGFYAPPEAVAGGEWREITVRVDGADEVRAVPGYYP